MGCGETVAIAEHRFKRRCSIERLMLTNFRSYGLLDLRLGAGHVVLFGANGAGKTNVLEALSMFAPGRGLRGAKFESISRTLPGEMGSRPWAVSAHVQGEEGTCQLGVGYMPGDDGEQRARRVARVDGVALNNPTELSDYVRFIWLTPAMDRLFAESLSERRRFFDRLISSFVPEHWRRWSAYELAMRERMSALKNNANIAWLCALERTAAEAGVVVAASRLAGVSELMRAMEMYAVSSFPRADVSVDGGLEFALAKQSAVDVEDQFALALERSRSADLERGKASVGPHLSDFCVRHRDKGREASQCSSGEQKALLIRLVLGAAAAPALSPSDAPVLLLDEISAHLDEKRRMALFDEIDGLGVQAWMSGTDRAAFSGLNAQAQFFEVEDGRVKSRTHF